MTYLYGINIATERQRPVEDVLQLPLDRLDEGSARWMREPARATEMAALVQDGFATFAEAQVSTAALAKQAMAGALSSSATDPVNVDAVMFSTESFWDTENPALPSYVGEPVRLRHALLQGMAEVGLSRAFPYANWLSACANLGSTLGLARSSILAGQHRRVMVVCADKVPPNMARMTGATVMSDLAAACVIGPERRGFELKAVIGGAAPAVAGFNAESNSPPELMKFMREMMLALKRLGADFERVMQRPLNSFETIISGHFHPFTLRAMCDVLQVKSEDLLRNGRSKYAHAYASDNLLTLVALDAEGKFAPGQQIVLLNSGVWSWNFIVLEKVAESTCH